MLRALDGAAVRRWAAVCVQSIDAQCAAINSINVYPIPDGDTGSNLLSTMRSALSTLLRAPVAERATAGAALTLLAKGAVGGARGNSGVICSQLVRGLADAVGHLDEVAAADLVGALTRAAELAATAVVEPVAGTMLTVLDAAADAARAQHSDSLHAVTTSAAGAAADALARTPRQLDVLAEAGVVDAGGRGVVVLLDALVTVVEERDEPAPPPPSDAAAPLVTPREAGSDEYQYEVMYLLDAAEEAANRLRTALGRWGDCVSVAGDGSGLWTVHVHCNDVGAVIEAGVETGRPRRITVARFADEAERVAQRFRNERVVVALVRGRGLAALFRAEGACVLEVTRVPDVWDLLAMITSTGVAQVTVLPGGGDLIPIADEAAARAIAAGQDVIVVPCASPVQALAALAVHDPARRAGDDVVAMAEAAAATRQGAVTVAAQDAITWIGPCRADDVLGFTDGEVVLIEQGPPSPAALARASCGVVKRMLATGGELVTVVLGARAPRELGPALRDFLRREHPEVDLSVFDGSGADDVVLLGIE